MVRIDFYVYSSSSNHGFFPYKGNPEAAAEFQRKVRAAIKFENRPRPPIDVAMDKAWVLSGDWAGHMGIAIGLNSNTYFYWCYSDVGRLDPVAYPLTNTITQTSDRFYLNGHSGEK